MIAGAGEISRITGCTLRYTDLIPVIEGTVLPGTEDIEQRLSGIFDGYSNENQHELVLLNTKIPDTLGSVCSLYNRSGKPGWTLIFTVKTEGPVRFVSGDDVVNWFDDARAGIHRLFDLIVPAEIVQTLR